MKPIVLVLTTALVGICACSDSTSEEEVPVIQANNGASNNGADNNGTANNGSANNGAANNGAVNNGAVNNGGMANVNDSCPPEARPVYVVEADVDNPQNQGFLVRFNARERSFTNIGQLQCPAQPGATPFSMSVDREGTAWVLYSSGELFEVSTTDASCQSTSFVAGQNGYDLFGMGFVLNNPMLQEETLYLAGGGSPGGPGSPRIGYLNFPELTITDLAPIGGWPEMSGTAAAELWAFFPGTQPPRVSRVVPATGEEVETFPVDSIDGQPNAWAFAHWGGNFYLFYKSQTDSSTRVFEMNGESGEVEEIISDTGRYIVGAGVSTCAPLVIL